MSLRRLLIAALTAGAFGTAGLAATKPDEPTFITVDAPGATLTEILGINNRGDIVGRTGASGGAFHGFVWTRDGFQLVVPPGATSSAARGINEKGDIVGEYFNVVTRESHGYHLSHGDYRDIDVPGASVLRTAPTDISNSGDIVGTYAVAGPSAGHAFILSRHSELILFDAPLASNRGGTFAWGVNGRYVVGSYGYGNDGERSSGFVRDDDGQLSVFNVPGAVNTSILGTNDRGDLVGSYQTTNVPSRTHGFILDSRGTFTTVDVPGADVTLVTGINDRGDIVGYWWTNGTSLTHGFMAQFGPRR